MSALLNHCYHWLSHHPDIVLVAIILAAIAVTCFAPLIGSGPKHPHRGPPSRNPDDPPPPLAHQ